MDSPDSTTDLPPPPKRVKKRPPTKKEKAETKEIRKKKVAEFVKLQKKKIDEKKTLEKKLKEKAEKQAWAYVQSKKRSGILSKEIEDVAGAAVVNEIARNHKVIFQPFPKQVAYLEAAEDHVLAGGGRGSGKSEAFFIEPLRYVSNPVFRGLFIRKNLKDLQDLIGRAIDKYKALIPSVQYKIKDQIFVFPSGATISFGHLDDEQAVEKYRGQEYAFIGIDEISQIPEYNWVSRLLGSLRCSDPNQKTYFRATTNWTGVGIDWVKEYFHVDTHPQGKTIVERSEVTLPDGAKKEVMLTKKWFNSTIFDNPKMANDTQYLAFLNSQPEYLKRAWLYGETTSVEGIAFPDFSKETHVIPNFEIPRSWKKFSGADYGYSDGAANIWIAVSPEGDHYVYREFVCNKKKDTGKHYTAKEFAQKALEIEQEAQEYVLRRIIDGSVWDKRGSNEPSLYDEMRQVGYIAMPADQTAGSRRAGKNKIHELLRIDPETKKPKLFVTDNCVNIIKMFYGLPLDSKNAEDVDTKHPLDCEYDALRYVLMSRPSGRPKLVGYNTPIIY
ncbi:MAG: hypothetical protein EBR82_48135 [Caulobacteraceae bacterium]|nr:hypothetical protein [Caulobacteraceae bacterium]